MRLSLCLTALLALLSLPTLAADISVEDYGYPLSNPFEATIATTPVELRAETPTDDDIDQRDYSLRLRPEREFILPDNFWAVKRLTYRLARQPGPAPLMFIISGTGASYSAGKSETLKRIFYGAGYHVVQLSSPTSFDFIASASRYATPGYSPNDAKDMYRVMQAIRRSSTSCRSPASTSSATAWAHSMPRSSASSMKPGAVSTSIASC